MRLTLTWWNSGLSPKRDPNRSSLTDMAVAIKVVLTLVQDFHADVIVLGEVSKSNVECIVSAINSALLEPFESVGDSDEFMFGVLFKRSAILVEFRAAIRIRQLNSEYRLAHEYRLFAIGCTDAIGLLVSHWPSRLNSGSAATRELLGTRLRDKVESILSEETMQHVIMLGDYNDEPFDKSLDQNLLATRDHFQVRRRGCLYYNPFWSNLGSNLAEGDVPPRGTYFHYDGRDTKWRVFDQIIFSSSFLQPTSWRLVEDAVIVGATDDLSALIRRHDAIFDHFPVLATVRRF